MSTELIVLIVSACLIVGAILFGPSLLYFFDRFTGKYFSQFDSRGIPVRGGKKH